MPQSSPATPHAVSNAPRRILRGDVLDFTEDPGFNPPGESPGVRFRPDHLVLIEGERIVAVQPASEALTPDWQIAEQLDHRGRLIMPGFIDTHVHCPQLDVIASYGTELLDWLNTYTFPAERRYVDDSVADEGAERFLEALWAHGTTSAVIFATVHKTSAEALFRRGSEARMRLVTGKVLMDRHAPDGLRDDVAQAERDCVDLIQRWHGRGRLRYSLTPRFAPTSSPEQLRLTGELLASQPGLHLQTHLAETPAELDWVQQLFPERSSYLDVYQHYGLAGPRTLHAHCIHLSAAERRSMAASGAAAAFCPGSNLFLGSGFFDLDASRSAGLRVGLATDIGAGTGFGLLRTLAQAYEVGQACRAPLSALRGFYLATLGGARALYLDEHIGNFQPGREADFIALDWAATPELAWRMERCQGLTERLFALMTLGDERCVVATHVMGEVAFVR